MQEAQHHSGLGLLLCPCNAPEVVNCQGAARDEEGNTVLGVRK